MIMYRKRHSQVPVKVENTVDFLIKTGLVIEKNWTKIVSFLNQLNRCFLFAFIVGHFKRIIFLLTAVFFLIFQIKELIFYKNFFESTYIKEYFNRNLFFLEIISVLILIFVLILKKIRIKEKNLIILVACILILVIQKNSLKHIREKFEYKPIILRILPDIASNWMEVKIIGRNFQNLPFEGKVYINEKEQRVIKWSDKEIIIEIDPILSQTGNIVVRNRYDWGEDSSNPVKFTLYDRGKATPEEEKRFWDSLIKYDK